MRTTSDVRRVKCQLRKNRHEAYRQANIERAASRPAVHPSAQLKALDFRLGAGAGAKKERAKLKARLKTAA